MPLLQTKGLGIRFGGLQALQDVNLTVNKGEIVGLIGPNGAGKTTVFNLLTEVYAPTEGTIELEGESLVGKKTYQVTQNGIARTFQNIRLFKDVSVLDNVKIAMTSQGKYSMAAGIFRLSSYWKTEKQKRRWMLPQRRTATEAPSIRATRMNQSIMKQPSAWTN